MRRKVFMVMGPKMVRYGLLLMAVGVGFTALTGCEQPLKENETYHKIATVWPLFDVEKWEWIDPETGNRGRREIGDAVCWLSTWEKEEHFDQDNFRIYRKEKNAFFPLWSTEVEESEEFINKKGSVLIFPYDSRRKK